MSLEQLEPREAPAVDLRIVSYNLAVSGSQLPRAGLGAVLQSIGNEVYNGESRPIDVLALQEVSPDGSDATAVRDLLNTIYGVGAYAAETTAGLTTGSGTQMLVYRTATIQVINTFSVGIASTVEQPRQTLRYQLRPRLFGTTNDFYLYNSHYKSDSGTADQQRRSDEANDIRVNADALTEGINVLYVGDFNSYSSNENFYSSILLGPGPGQAFDPLNAPGSWSGNTGFAYLHTQSPATVSAYSGQTLGGVDDRFDFQLISGELLDGTGMEYAPGSYHVFGNNGTTFNQAINFTSNTIWSSPTDPLNSSRTSILNALASVSDHLPVVADYRIGSGLVTVSQTGGSTDVTEGGADDSYTVVLGAAPTGNVTITIGAGTQLTVNPPSLTFNTSNWNTPQTVIVSAVNDGAIEGPHSGTITHSSSSTDARYNNAVLADVAVAITDNEANVVITQTDGSTIVAEAGGSDSYSVVLNRAPSANVTITLNSGSQLTALPATLVFTPANWNTPQAVAVTAVNDSTVEGLHSGTITHSVSSADGIYNGSAVPNVTAVISDDEASVTITQSGGATNVTEGGATDSYTVVLTRPPTSAVTITLVSDQVTTLPALLTFTTANWSTPRTVTVTAVNDLVVEGFHLGTVTHAISSADTSYNALAVADVTVNISDNDGPTFSAAWPLGSSANDVATDAAGNMYVTGRFSGIVDFDPSAGFFQLNGGAESAYVAKYSVTGAFVWARQLPGVGRSVAVDAAGNVYTVGDYNGSGDFDPGPGAFLLSGSDDVFISKLDSAGNFVWATSLGGAFVDNAQSIAVDAAGNVLVGGEFRGDADLDPGPTSFIATSNGGRDAFIVRLNTAGAFAWGVALGGPSDDLLGDLALDSNGDVVATGAFAQTVDFDPSAASLDLTSVLEDIYIAKYSSAGALVWARQMIGNGNDAGSGIAVDAFGNIYSTGLFRDTIDLDPGQGVFNATSASVNTADTYVSKLSSSGDFVWARTIGAVAGEEGHGIALDASGHVFFTGQFFATTDFDPGLGTFNISSAGSNDIFVARLDSAGSFGWAASMGGANTDNGLRLAVDNFGAVYTVGTFRDTADFDPGPGTFNIVAGTSNVDLGFVSKLTQNFAPDVTIVQTGGNTSVTEGGAADTYTVVLNAATTADVVITINAGSQATVTPATLTFTPLNWGVPQTVTVTAVNDFVLEGTHTAAIIHSASSANANYNGIAISNVTANIQDNDLGQMLYGRTGGFPSNLIRIDSGTAAALQVGAVAGPIRALDFRGSQLYTFDGASKNIVEIDPATGATLNSININFPDAVYNSDGMAFRSDGIGFLHGGANGTELYRFDITTGTTTLISPTTSLFLLSLDFNSADVLYGVISGNLVTVDQTTGVATIVGPTGIVGQAVTDLAFAANDNLYAVAQVQSAPFSSFLYRIDTVSGAATLVGSIGIDNVDGLAFGPLAGVTITASDGTTAVSENGGNDTYSVVLNRAPIANVTIALNPGNQVNVSSTSLTFTPTNWNVPQTVTVTAVNDVTPEGNHNGVVVHSASSADASYNGVAIGAVTVLVSDNDATGGVTIAHTGASTDVTEGATGFLNPAHVYDLNGTYADQFGGPTIVPDGGFISGGRYVFGANQGLRLSGALANVQTYSVVMTMELDSTSPFYKKIFDLANRTRDAGLYVAGSNLQFYPGSAGADVITPNVDFQVALTRDGLSGQTRLYLNGVLQQIYTGSVSNEAVPLTNLLIFVEDDTVTPNEAGAGSIDRIAVFNTVLSAADVAALAIGGSGGAGDSYSVVLNSPPSANVTVTVTPDSQVTTGPGSVVFTPSNWFTPQTINVNAVDDLIIEGPHTGTVAHTVSSTDLNFNNIPVADMVVNVTDNDEGISITETGGSTDIVEGGGSDTYSIVLNFAPTNNVFVNLNPGTQATVTPTTLAFTPANWNTPRTVTVAAVDDAAIEGLHTAAIRHTSTSADPRFNALVIRDLIANVTDNDAFTFTETGTSTDVSEDGTTDVYSLVLNAAPTANVVVTLTGGAQLLVAPTTLTFTPADWNTPQSATVSAIDDNVPEGFHVGAVGHSFASADATFNGLTANLAVNITDNDATALPGVTIVQSGGSTSVSESGASDTYTVRLNSAPSANVVIALNGGAQLTVTPPTLTFTPSDWNLARTVTVSGFNDTFVEGPHTGAVTHTVTSLDLNYDGILAPTVTAAITDNDIVSTLYATTTGLGSNRLVSISTTNAITTTVGFMTGTNTMGLGVRNNRLYTFDASNTNRFRELDPATAAVLNTFDVGLPGGVWNTGGLAFRADGQGVLGNGFSSGQMYQFDISAQNSILVGNNSPSMLAYAFHPITSVLYAIGDPGGFAGIQLYTIDIVTGAATVIGQTFMTSGSLGGLAFDAAGNLYAMVSNFLSTSRLYQINISNGQASFIGFPSVSGLQGIAFRTPAGIIISQSGGSTDVMEGAGIDTYSIVLATQPTSDVIITLSPGNQLDVQPQTLTFTASNWSVPQAVTVSATLDNVLEGPHSGVITHSVTSGDASYNGIAMGSVSVNITDNFPAVIITPTGSTDVSESGIADNYTVVLNSIPTGSVDIQINPDGQLFALPATLSFNASNWNVPQTVSLTGVDDGFAEGLHTGVISHVVTSQDGNYHGIFVPDAVATVVDNDFYGISVVQTGGATDVTEGAGFDTYTVALTAIPSADVTITLVTGNQLNLSTTTLTFNPANWNVPQTITVTAIDDNVPESAHTGTIGHTVVSGDTNYNGMAVANILVTITDNPATFGFALRLGNDSAESGHAVATDALGNFYVTGQFAGVVDFDPGPGLFQLSSSAGSAFVAKYSNTGVFLWARQLGGAGQGITVDSAGNVYATGQFAGTADFDPGPGIVNLASAGNVDVFVSKLDNAGNFVWARRIGGADVDFATALAVGSGGNVSIIGHFQGTIDLNPGTGVFNRTSAGQHDVFAVRLDGAGNFIWGATWGGQSDDFGYDIAVDSGGNVYTTGQFTGTADLDPGAASLSVTSAGQGDIFVAKLNNSGALVWAQRIGGTGDDQAHAIDLDGLGNVYLSGGFRGTVDFAPGTAVFDLTSAGQDDIFVSKLDSAGNFVWARRMGGAGSDFAFDIDVDAAGTTYLAGKFEGAADFDPSARIIELVSKGLSDIFVAELDPNGNFSWARSMGSPGIEFAFGVAVDPLANVYTTGFFRDAVDFDPSPGDFTLSSTTLGIDDIFITKFTQFGAVPAVSLSSSGGVLNVSEGGATDSYSVVLNSAPTADVTITLTANAQLMVLPTTLTFTPGNWNTPQTVTVVAVNDTDVEGLHSGAVTHAAVSADVNYNGISIVNAVVSIGDNDLPTFVTVAASGGATLVLETGGSDTYSVVLDFAPTADVTITIIPDNQVAVLPNTLTFTPLDWDQPQTVTVLAVDDVAFERTHTGTIRHTISSSDPTFNNSRAPNVTATIADNDSTGFAGGSDSTVIPPDTMGAVGPNHFVEIVNGRVTIYSKTGTPLSSMSTDAFFDPDGAGPLPQNGTFGQRILYDRLSGRWFASILENGTVPQRDNDIILAVSRTADPTGVWDRYIIPVAITTDPGVDSYFSASATLGIDSNGVYFGVEIRQDFGDDGTLDSSFAKIVATPLAPLIGGIPGLGGVFQFSNITDMFAAPQPAHNFDSIAANGPAWFVSSDPFVASREDIRYRTLTWSGSIPILSGTFVMDVATSIQNPLNVNFGQAPALLAPDPNDPTPIGIDTGDHRLQMAVIRNGRLWTTRNVGLGSTGTGTAANRVGVEWFELDTSGATLVEAQSDRIFDASAVNPYFYYYPSLMVNGQGHMVIGFSGSRAGEAVSAYVARRLASDALDSTGPLVQLKAGEAGYQITQGLGRNRWGETSYTSLDPADDMTFWTIQEYAAAPSSTWGAWIARLPAPAPVVDTIFVGARAGQSGVTLNLTGADFFDPGAAFSNRLSVQITGGAVNGISNIGVTYIDASSVALTFDIAANASIGPRDVVLVNPDGQSVTAVAALVINDVPQLDLNGAIGGSNFAATFTEDGGPVAVGDATLTVTDASPALLFATVTIENLQDGAAESLTADTTGAAISAVYDSVSGTLALTGSDTPANYQAVLRSVRYNNTSQTPRTTPRAIRVLVSDGLDASAVVTSTMTVVSVNDAPVLSDTSALALPDIMEDSTTNDGMLVSALIASSEPPDRIVDVDLNALEGIAIVVTDNTQGRWEFSTNDGVTWGELLGASESNARLLSLDAATRIRFDPNLDFSGPVAGLTYRAWDQTAGSNGATAIITATGGATAFSTATATIGITVLNVNDAPVVDLNGPDGGGLGFTTTFTEGGAPVAIGDTDLTVTDVDSSTYASATVSINNRQNGVNEVLTATSSAGISAVYNITTGILTLTGVAPRADYETVLRSVRYNNASQSPGTTPRTIQVVVNDGAASSVAAVSTISIAIVNNAPISLSLSNNSINENNFLSAVIGTFSTVDPDNSVHTYSLVAGPGSDDNAAFSIVSNQLRAAVVFNYESKDTYSIRVRSGDSGGEFIEQEFTIVIIDVPDPPTVSLANTVTSISETANAGGRVKVADIIVTGGTPGATNRFLGGSSAGVFEIIGDELFVRAGVTLDAAITPQLFVTVQVDDTTLGSSVDASAQLVVNVTDNVTGGNNAPSLSLIPVVTDVSDGTTAGFRIKVADIVVTDDTLGTNVLSLSGADAGLFEIIGTELYIRAGAAFNYSVNPLLDVTVNVDDSSVGSSPDDSESFTVRVSIVVSQTSPRNLFDEGGEKYLVRLTGPGQAFITLSDDDSDGRGSIARIVLQGTDPRRSRLFIGLVNLRSSDPPATFRDRLVTIGAIEGSGLASLTARNSDLVGAGIDLVSPLGSLLIGNVRNGADIIAGGGIFERTTITANIIEDGTDIRIGSSLTALRALSVGNGSVQAPSLGAMVVRGAFNSDLTLTGDPRLANTLGRATITGGISDAVWAVLGNAGAITASGAINNWQLNVQGKLASGVFGNVESTRVTTTATINSIRALSFSNSFVYAGFTPNVPTDPMAGGIFTAAAINVFSVTSGAFANSIIAASSLGRVSLRSLGATTGPLYGVLADLSIRSVIVTFPTFRFNPLLPTPQNFGSFQVSIL